MKPKRGRKKRGRKAATKSKNPPPKNIEPDEEDVENKRMRMTTGNSTDEDSSSSDNNPGPSNSTNRTVNSNDSEDQTTSLESQEKYKEIMNTCKDILESYIKITQCEEAVTAVETYDPNLLETIMKDLQCKNPSSLLMDMFTNFNFQNSDSLTSVEIQRKETLAGIQNAKQHFNALKKPYLYMYIGYVTFMFEVMTYLAKKYKDSQ